MSILSVKKHYLKVESHYKRLTRISLIPWGFYTLFILITSFTTGMESIVWPITIPIWISLLVSGVGLTSSNKKWNIAAWISILMLVIGGIAIGYYDYFHWFSTKLCVGLGIFFLIIFMMKRLLDCKKVETASL